MTLQQIVLIFHVGVCLLVVALVLLQRGKGAEAGTGFGAGASGTVFGARGSANFLSRATAALATAFFVTSLALAFLGTQGEAPRSILERTVPSQQTDGQPGLSPPAEGLDEPPPLPAGDAPAADELPPIGADSGAESPEGGQPN